MTPDQFAQALVTVCKASFLGAFVACAVGAFFGRAAYHGLFLLVRRTRSWRRLDRAMRRLFA